MNNDEWKIGELLYFDNQIYYIIKIRNNNAFGIFINDNREYDISDKDDLIENAIVYPVKPHTENK